MSRLKLKISSFGNEKFPSDNNFFLKNKTKLFIEIGSNNILMHMHMQISACNTIFSLKRTFSKNSNKEGIDPFQKCKSNSLISRG